MKKKLGKMLEPSVAFFFFCLLGFAVITLIRGDYLLCGIECAVTVIIYVIYRLTERHRMNQIQSYVSQASAVQGNMDSFECPLAMVMIRPGDGSILWSNESFQRISGYQEKLGKQNIADYLPGFSSDWLAAGKTEYAYDVTLNKRRFRINGSTFWASDRSRTMLAMLYLSDLTELYLVRDEYIRSRPVVSLLLIDNYEELTKNLTEGAISTLNAKIDEVITTWCEGYHGLLRRLERNRYLFVFESRYLKSAEEGKFSVLEDIHRVVNPAGVQASLSCGFGVDCESFEEGYRYAALSIEMALSRGGNQAVVKNMYEFMFYGGVEREADHSTRVRTRVMSNTLMELISQSESVYVMGHKSPDLDSLGSAMGVVCMCRKAGARANIVLDNEVTSIQLLLDQVKDVKEYKDVFTSSQEALLHCNSRSLLVVVDTNRPDQVQSLPLLEAISRVCVIDHHRRAADYIENVAVNCQETSASSACELVTEFLQYTVETSDVLPIEAQALLAGIFLDTKGFQVRTGERTFEAAALLNRMGADSVEVKKLFKNDFQNTIAKYQIIKSAKLFRQEIAIAALNTSTTRMLAAQAADELLNISGITASFVLYPQDESVIVSARSIGDLNVQLILEPLGGGGNAATAGAQISGKSVKEALDALVERINQFYEDRQETLKKRKTERNE